MFACARPCAAMCFELFELHAVSIQYLACRKNKVARNKADTYPGETAGLRVDSESCGAVYIESTGA